MNAVFNYLIYFWLCWVLVAVWGFLSLWQAGATLHCGARASPCRGSSCCGAQAPGHAAFSSCGTWAQQLCCTGPIVVANGLNCSVTCGIFLDQGSNMCLLHWQVDSSPLSQRGSPEHSLCHLYLLPLGRMDSGKSPLVRSPLKDVFFSKSRVMKFSVCDQQ